MRSGEFDEEEYHERDLAKEDQRHEQLEVPMLGLVPEDVHAEDGAERAAEQGNDEQRRFGRAPFALFCLPFIGPHRDETDDAHDEDECESDDLPGFHWSSPFLSLSLL